MQSQQPYTLPASYSRTHARQTIDLCYMCVSVFGRGLGPWRALGQVCPFLAPPVRAWPPPGRCQEETWPEQTSPPRPSWAERCRVASRRQRVDSEVASLGFPCRFTCSPESFLLDSESESEFYHTKCSNHSLVMTLKSVWSLTPHET